MSKFFVNTGDGTDLYDTAEDAAAAAQRAIDGWRDCCDTDWPEEVDNVYWGPVFGMSFPESRGENNEYEEWVLKPQNVEYRCNLCGGVVRFDGTKPKGTLP